ncbi:MAG: succinylglutamate desuccinylase/aspartoacylase family protein [Pseudomonadota bacterium]
MLTLLRDPRPEDIPERVNDFLQSLPGPVAIAIRGRDSSRSRVLVTLSHGNEPSGLGAVHRWLRQGRQPETNVSVVMGAVDAALAEPLFFHRQLPATRDLNRCFNPPYKDRQGEIAQAMLAHIREQSPEAVVDMHNTSGSSAAFAVSIGDAAPLQALVSHFCERMVVTDLRLGSLMEQDLGCPTVTIECGGARDEASDVIAHDGVERFFCAPDLFEGANEVSLFRHPLRLELSPHSRIEYAERPLHDRDVTVRQDIERFNFVPLGATDMLGWVDEHGLSHLRIGSDYQPHDVQEFFRIKDGILFPQRGMRLFMATTRPDIAASDCLFYFVCE